MAGPISLRDQAVAVGKQFAEAETKMAGQVASRLANGITQPGWAETKLAQVQALNKELQATVDATMADAKGSIGDLMTDAYSSAQGATINAGEAGDSLRGNLGSMNTAGMAALAAATFGRIDAGGDQMLRSTVDAYRSIIADAAAGVVSGVDTRIGATQAALNEFANQGITGFTDTAGRAWSLSSYAEMATRTAATRSYTEGKLDTFRAAGISMFQLSSDGSPCDVCAPWEGEIVVDDGADNPDGLPTISDMEGDGVFHANCGHTLDAVSDAAYDNGIVTEEKMTDEELATAAEDYKNAQTQRYMERQVQDWKTRDVVSITPEAKAQSEAKISEWQGKLRDFTESTGLPRYYDREGVTSRDVLNKLGVKQMFGSAPDTTPESVVAEPSKWTDIAEKLNDGKGIGRAAKGSDELTLQKAITTWTGGAYLPFSGLSDAEARSIIEDIVKAAPSNAPTLYRGMTAKITDESPMGRMFRDVQSNLQVGNILDLNVSSWSSIQAAAEEFAAGPLMGWSPVAPGPGYVAPPSIMFVQDAGAKALNIQKYAGDFAYQKEWANGGRFVITNIEQVGNRYTVHGYQE